MIRITSFFPLILCFLGIYCLLPAAACDNDDDDNDDHDQDDDDDNDNQTENPTIGACICCFTENAEVWGYCWNVGFADECEEGCARLYDESHLLDVLFDDGAACADHHSHQECRAL